MPRLRFEQPILQLEKRKGGYYYLFIDAKTVNQFTKGKATRIRCEIDNTVTLPCGFSHLGDGNFYILVAKRYVRKLKKDVNDLVCFEIYEDPNPLGVDIPEALEVLLAQDEYLKSIFDGLTDGKKRSLVFSIQRIKNIDLQVQRAIKILEELNAQSRA